ncbi:mobile mystery protein A [Leptospira wolffii]|nr:mobile mystery protein A [Leptospira wolffii]
MKLMTLQMDQLDRKFSALQKVEKFSAPPSGWIYAIRTALGMTLKQLGTRMGISPQSVREMEAREKAGTVSLKVLKQFGESMDMKLVYGFIPARKSLQQMLEDRALEIATEIVMRTSVNMQLEGQKNSPQRLEKAIRTRAKEILEKRPKYLWDSTMIR